MDSQRHFSYIYLTQEREFVRLNDPVFQLSVSCRKAPAEHLRSHKPGTRVVVLMECPAGSTWQVKRELTAIYRMKHERHEDGPEYFRGCEATMREDVCHAVLQAWRKYELAKASGEVVGVEDEDDVSNEDSGTDGYSETDTETASETDGASLSQWRAC